MKVSEKQVTEGTIVRGALLAAAVAVFALYAEDKFFGKSETPVPESSFRIAPALF